jgi:DNA-binding response OmpR family regulator
MSREHKDILSILLADDDEDDRFLFQSAFEEIQKRVKILTVSDGDQLMRFLYRNHDLLPDILFLDLNLIRKNGMECLAEIRRDRTFDELIVAIYSTSSSRREINETYKLGADVYIRKPNDFISLVNILTKVCNTNWNSSRLSHDDFLIQQN